MKFGSIRAAGQVVATGSISSNTTALLTGSGQLANLGYATTGSNTFTGTQTMAGSIIPSVNNTYDLGSPTYQFRHVYISSGSLYVNGTKVLGSTSQELQITTDVGQSFKILESGSDTITLQSADGNITLTSSGGGDVILDPNTGVIALKGTTTVYSGYKIVSSDGNAIQFGNGIAITGSIIATGTSLVSGSSQITFSGLSGIPSGLVSGSSQVLSGTGIISSSAQESGFGYATTGSNTFQGAQTVNGSLVVTGNLTAQQYIVSSSVVYLTESFSSGSHKFGDSLDDNHNFTGSVYISGSYAGVKYFSGGNFYVSTDANYDTTRNYTFRDAIGISNPNGSSSATGTTVMSIGSMSNGVSLITTGYIGVSKNSANAQLDVNGNAIVSGSLTVTSTVKGAAYFDAQTSSGFRIRNSVDSANVGGWTRRGLWEGNSNYDPALWAETGYGLYFYTNGSANIAARINTSGFLGVGGVDPTVLLHVKKANNSDWMAAFDNTGTNPYGLRIDTSTNSGSAYSLAVYTNINNGFYVLNNGRTGIGVNSSLNGWLDIRGSHIGGYGLLNMYASDNCLIAMDVATGYDCRIRMKLQGVDKWLIGMNTNDSFEFKTNDNAVRLSVSQSGDVTSPGDVYANKSMNVARYTRVNGLYEYVKDGPYTSSAATVSVIRQFHDAANWCNGGILVEITCHGYATSEFDHAIYFVRYGYGGNSTSIDTRLAPITNRITAPYWGSAINISGNDYYRDLLFDTQAYRVYKIVLKTIMPPTTNSTGAGQGNQVYLFGY